MTRFVLLAGLAILASLATFVTPSRAALNNRLVTEGRYTFEQLGWAEDQVLTEGAPSASLTFELPEGISQGKPLWYGVRMVYEFSAEIPSNQFLFFYVRWNAKSLYQFKAKSESWDTAGGFEWSMVDFVNGISKAYEHSGRIRAASSNVATLDGVGDGGGTEITVELDTKFARGAPVQLVVSKESEVIATRWRPPSFEGTVTARRSESELVLSIDATNRGWHTQGSRLDAVVALEDGSTIELSGTDRGPVAALGSVAITETWVLPSEPVQVTALFSWGDGLGTKRFPARLDDGSSWPDLGWLIGGFWAGLIAFVLAWVAFSSALGKGAEISIPIPSARIGEMAVICATALAGGLLAMSHFSGSSDGRDLTSLGPLPFPHARELAHLDDKTRSAAIESIQRDPLITSLFLGEPWEIVEIMSATEQGESTGVYAALLAQGGIPGRGPWLWRGCHSPVLGESGVSEVPGAIVVLDGKTGGLTQITPLAGVPDGIRLDVAAQAQC